MGLVLKPLKWVVITWAVLLAGQWIRWDGRSLGQHADRAQARAFGWASQSLSQLASGAIGNSVDQALSATTSKSAPSRVERAKLRELIRELE